MSLSHKVRYGQTKPKRDNQFSNNFYLSWLIKTIAIMLAEELQKKFKKKPSLFYLLTEERHKTKVQFSHLILEYGVFVDYRGWLLDDLHVDENRPPPDLPNQIGIIANDKL